METKEYKKNYLIDKFNINSIPEIEVIETELLSILSDSRGGVRDICSQLLGAGGKRLRPLFVLYSGMIFSPLAQELVNAAVAAELIHMASLVHDDIIDNSSLRRSKPSVNHSWGNHIAVLCGDYLFAKAFGILSKNRLIGSMDYMVYAIENMCQGEILQACSKYDFNINVDTYFDCISKKTAIFLECCCKSGAFVAGASEDCINTIGEYGLNMGLAFQIVDDILDFCGDEKMTGKPKFEDLRQGNITLPVLTLLNNEQYRSDIKELIIGKSYSNEVLEEVAEVMIETGIIRASFDIASNYIKRAKACLMMLPQSQYITHLYNYADVLMRRVN